MVWEVHRRSSPAGPGRACSKAGTGGWDWTGAGSGEAQNLRVTHGTTGSEDPLLRP